MQHSPYKIKYEQYFVMYSDRLKRRYYQGKPWAEQALIQFEIFIILIKLIELLYNRHLE